MAPPGEAAPVLAAPMVAPSMPPPYGAQRKQPPWMAIAMIVAALAFGTMGGVAVFFKPTPPAQVVVQVPATPTAPAPTAAPTAAAPTATTEPTSSAAVAANASGPRAGGGGGAGSHASAAAPAPTKQLNLGGIGRSGPAPEDFGNEGPAAPGQCLSSGQVQNVIGLHQVGIRRTCWDRNPTNKPSVKVNVSLTVGPDGSAQNVSATGDEPSVAKCIENDVQNWHFPAMNCSQKTGFSFNFVKQ
jgi:hypothetical protein